MKDIELSKPFIEEVEMLKEEIQKKRQEKSEVGAGLGELKELTKKLNDEIGKLKKEQDQKQSTKELF